MSSCCDQMTYTDLLLVINLFLLSEPIYYKNNLIIKFCMVWLTILSWVPLKMKTKFELSRSTPNASMNNPSRNWDICSGVCDIPSVHLSKMRWGLTIVIY